MKKGWKKCKTCDGFGQFPDSATAYDVQDTTCPVCLGDGKLPPTDFIDEVQEMGKLDKKKLNSLWDKISSSELLPNKIETLRRFRVFPLEIGKSSRKNPEAVKLGSLGGKARAKKLTPQRRLEISQKANKAKLKSPLNKEIK